MNSDLWIFALYDVRSVMTPGQSGEDMQNALCLEAINSSLTINHTTMNMMRRLWLIWLFVAAMIANSCTNLTDVEDRLDALEEEVR